MKWEEDAVSTGELRNAYKMLVLKTEGNPLLGRLRRKRENDIKMDLKETESESVDWIRLVRDRLQ
jgi:hypothetical protein